MACYIKDKNQGNLYSKDKIILTQTLKFCLACDIFGTR